MLRCAAGRLRLRMATAVPKRAWLPLTADCWALRLVSLLNCVLFIKITKCVLPTPSIQ